MQRAARVVVCLSLLCMVAGSASAATLPAGFTETPIASGLSSPTAMAMAPDGRIFVCLQGGTVRVIKNGALLPTPFVQLTVDSDGERGLLGIAFDPNFASNQFVYLYYTVPSPAHNRVSRFTASGDVAAPGSQQPILDLENLSGATNHNGGAIHFGPDGKLYVAVGENANAPNSQTLDNRLGKMLRINSNGSIPSDNPYVSQTTGVNQAIWAIGLRNPFTFAFDPNPSQPRMFINDVGQSSWEEINDGLPGVNYGWPNTEGPTTDPRFRSPRYAYANDASTCAITGGAFYSPISPQFPADYAGDYFFGDSCAGWIKRLDVATNTVTDFATNVGSPVDVVVAPDGILYYLAREGGGRVFRVQFTAAGNVPSLTAFTNGLTLSLSWTSPGATSYLLQAGSSASASNLFNANVGNIRTIEGIVPPGRYFLRVRAVGPSGTSGPSNEVDVTVAGTGPCATAPPTPAGFVAQGSGLNASLAWNTSPSTTFYVLEAGSQSGAVNVFQGSVGLVTAVTAQGAPGTFFTRVRAANSCGVSAPSTEVPITLGCNAAAPSALTATKAGPLVTFRWNAAAGATSYRLLVGTSSGQSNLLNVDVGAITSITVSTAGVPNGNYFIRVVAQSGCGLSAPSNQATLQLP